MKTQLSKRFLSLLLLVFLISSFTLTKAQELGTLFPPIDCTRNPNFFIRCPTPMVWEGPKNFSICTDDYDDPSLITCDSCCFNLIYYESFCTIPQQGGVAAYSEYHINVAGITIDGDENCLNCDKEIIENLLTTEMLKYKTTQDTNFMNRWYGTNEPFSVPFYRHTRGTCKNSEEVTCGTTCCVQRMNIEFDTLTPYDYIGITTGNYWNAYEQCTSGCNIICNDFPYVSTGNLRCPGLPCDKGVWQDFTEIVPLPGCQGCNAIVKYKRKNNEQCDPKFIDFKLEEVQLITDGCETCIISDEQLYRFAASWILKKGAVDFVSLGHTNEFFRLLNFSCWGSWMEDVWPYDELEEKVFKKCGIDRCCWSRYSVTKDDSGNVDIQFIENNNDSVACQFWIHLCIFVCGINLSTNYIVPYPPDNKTTSVDEENSRNLAEINNIVFESSSNEDVELEVYSVLGNLIFSNTYKKEGKKINISLEKEKIKSGTVAYRIIQKKKIQKTGIVNIVH